MLAGHGELHAAIFRRDLRAAARGRGTLVPLSRHAKALRLSAGDAGRRTGVHPLRRRADRARRRRACRGRLPYAQRRVSLLRADGLRVLDGPRHEALDAARQSGRARRPLLLPLPVHLRERTGEVEHRHLAVKLPLRQIDAFTSRLFGGNPAAVVLLDAWLADETLQAIALENNLSETAFVIPRAERSPLL